MIEPENAVEYDGVGSTIDAAIRDAVAFANHQTNGVFGANAEVTAWGINAGNTGDSCSFWARIRKVDVFAAASCQSRQRTSSTSLGSGE